MKRERYRKDPKTERECMRERERRGRERHNIMREKDRDRARESKI